MLTKEQVQNGRGTDKMEIDWASNLSIWTLAGAMAAIWIRLEVGQALNKLKVSTLEKQRGEDNRGVHSRIQRHENKTDETLKEIRDDIKELLKRHN